MSTQVCEHPPLFMAHSSVPHLSVGSSWNSGQSGCLSHTFDNGIHIPPPQSNSVFKSHVRTAIAGRKENKKKKIKLENYFIYLFMVRVWNESFVEINGNEWITKGFYFYWDFLWEGK